MYHPELIERYECLSNHKYYYVLNILENYSEKARKTFNGNWTVKIVCFTMFNCQHDTVILAILTCQSWVQLKALVATWAAWQKYVATHRGSRTFLNFLSTKLCINDLYWQKHIPSPNASTFLYFGYDWYFIFSLLKFQHNFFSSSYWNMSVPTYLH